MLTRAIAEAFACEIETPARERRESEVISMDEGEARYVEVLHVHNASADDALLGLMLHVEPTTGVHRSTRVWTAITRSRWNSSRDGARR